LRGELLDLVSQEPLEAGLVVLRGADGSLLGTTQTNDRGGWVFDLPRPGVYYLQAQRVGYESWLAGPVVMSAGEDTGYFFHLRPKPILLDPIEVSVEATRRHLELSGFYERQRSDFGTFLEPEEIEGTTAHRITEMLLGLPGVRLVATNAGSAGGRFIQLRGSDLSGGGLCRPRVFVDGLLFARGDSEPREASRSPLNEFEATHPSVLDQSLSLDDIGPPGDVAAIELYRIANQVPVRFGGTSVETLCGVIVVWTKRRVIRPNG
jgi:hypothetical protein